jgi:hypothetical protein
MFSIHFWSEPGAPLLCQVASGRRDEELRRMLRPDSARWAEARGCKIGGAGEDYRCPFPIDTPGDIPAAARFVVDALIAVAGYEGQTRLVAALAHDNRSRFGGVYDSFSETELARAFANHGFRVEWLETQPGELVDPPAFRASKAGTDSFVQMMDPIPGQRLYGSVRFGAEVSMTAEAGMLGLGAIHAFTGGVTADWLMQRVHEWDEGLAEHRRTVKRDRKRKGSPSPFNTVH